MINDIKLSRDFQKSVVCSTYDSTAIAYSKRNEMQSSNLTNLLNYLNLSRINIQGKILDVGCGLGTAKKYLDNFRANQIDYTGIDISQGMLDIANRLTSKPFFFIRADAETLPFDDLIFDLVVSNSTYHWLNIPEINITPKKAWKEAYRVLKEGEYLAFSISGENTAKAFQKCYHEISNQYKEAVKFNSNLYRLDPIGSMNLCEVERILKEVGFQIIFSTCNYEPVEFKNPSDYVDAVEAYGYDIYLSPFHDDIKKDIWMKLKDRFVEYIGNGKYLHDQYMIYIIAKKTSANIGIAASGAGL